MRYNGITIIDNLRKRFVTPWLNNHPSIKQWLWFVSLWILGILSASALTYPFKILINNLK